jgi:hypothetical protein
MPDSDCQHTEFKFLMYLPEHREFPGRYVRVYACPCGVQLDDSTADQSLQIHTPEPWEADYIPAHRRPKTG